MAVTIIPNVTNWTVTPQNGQAGYFTLMNTWLGQSTSVIQSLYDAIEAQNMANSEINALAIKVQDNADITVAAKDEAVGALAILSAGAIDDTNIATNKTFSNQHIQDNYYNKSETYNKTQIDSFTVKLTGDQTIDDVKEFTTSPIVPTPTAGDNSTKVATTEFVNNEIGAANSSLVKTALNANGNAPIYACRAWVNFNGTGTVAIRASGNVSSITDNGVGNYTVNFTTAMPDANYAVASQVMETYGQTETTAVLSQTVSSFRATHGRSGVGQLDSSLCRFAIFR